MYSYSVATHTQTHTHTHGPVLPLTSAPAQAACQVIPCAQGQYGHGRMPGKVGFVCTGRSKVLLHSGDDHHTWPHSNDMQGQSGSNGVVLTRQVNEYTVVSVPMQSRIQPTVPSPPQASTRKSGTSWKKLSLGEDHFFVMASELNCTACSRKLWKCWFSWQFTRCIYFQVCVASSLNVSCSKWFLLPFSKECALRRHL